jgi:hypothetical protein
MDEKKERKFIKLCLIPGGVAEESFQEWNDKEFPCCTNKKKGSRRQPASLSLK